MIVGWVFILIKKLSKEERAVNVVLHFTTFSVFATLPFLPFVWVTPNLQDAAYLVIAGVCGAVAQIFITKAFHYGPAFIISSFGFTQVLIAMIFGITFFGDQLALNTIVGGTIVIICGVIISKFQDKLVKQI
jgi:S-adenosylmethionine uptake transporter